MIHVATVHFKDPRWIEIQTSMLRTMVAAPLTLWASLEGIPSSYERHFDHVVPSVGMHSWKLNLLAAEISHVADNEDLIVFLDGDAFPVADMVPAVRRSLSDSGLLAVQRLENGGDPQPHPMFAATTVATWKRISGDWSPGWTWNSAYSGVITDVGGNLMRALQRNGVSWTPLHRSHQLGEHPVFFGVYGGLVYHHGAGFRRPVTRADRVAWSSVWKVGDQVRKALFYLARIPVARRNARRSHLIYQMIRDNPQLVLDGAIEVRA